MCWERGRGERSGEFYGFSSETRERGGVSETRGDEDLGEAGGGKRIMGSSGGVSREPVRRRSGGDGIWQWRWRWRWWKWSGLVWKSGGEDRLEAMWASSSELSHSHMTRSRRDGMDRDR